MDEPNTPASGRPGWLRLDSRQVLGAFGLLLFIGSFMGGAPWAGFHGVLLACVGVLVWLAPPRVALPRSWRLLTIIGVLALGAALMPAAWFAQPSWRAELAGLGLDMGPVVAIQWRQAAELSLLLGVMWGIGLWLAGRRAGGGSLRRLALAFTLGVAVYAVAARLMQCPWLTGRAAMADHFGFFPNRNHSGTYLAMGAVCGLGCILQAIRDKRFTALTLALVATAVCLWAVAAWSVSRGGVALVGVGALAWLAMLDRHYLGKHGSWAVALLALTACGLFLIADSAVKQRILTTVEKAADVTHDPIAAGDPKPAVDAARDLDFRVPTALDTLGLIRDFPWTGVGSGQYYEVFPQYRKLTAVANHTDNYHPESDWLWLAAESGVPAALVLLSLVVLAAWQSWSGIRTGRDRALRAACLAAALLVPVHGCFDVPGHRVVLAWSAAWLLALSLPPPRPRDDDDPVLPRAWPSRVGGWFLIALGVFLIRAQWFGATQPAHTAASTALATARLLYQHDLALQQQATAEGRPYQPAPADDHLESALRLLAQAEKSAPLCRMLYRYQAALAFNFDDKYPLIDRAFAIDRALDPTWIDGPLRQAEAWSTIDPAKTAALWNIALQRARAVDALDPANPQHALRTILHIRHFARGKPELLKICESLANPS